MKPTIGRIVHYVLKDGPNAGSHRPAIIVRVWTETCVQLQVFMDGANDGDCGNVKWFTSVSLNDTAELTGTWHWPERE